MKIIAAISGGVDSCVMLHQLVQRPEDEVVVAHYNHNMRQGSDWDTAFVKGLAEHYGLDFIDSEATSELKNEAQARDARWNFLRQAREEHKADVVATAHHQDDILETMIINIRRGTGRLGLTSLRETDDIIRPVITMTKEDIYRYAAEHRLEWIEDPTNRENRYERNKIRHYILPKFNYYDRDTMLAIRQRLITINDYLEQILTEFINDRFSIKTSKAIGDRREFNQWPYTVRKEIVKFLWQKLFFEEVDSRDIERFVIAVATARPGAKIDGSKHIKLDVSQTDFTIYLVN